MSTSEIHRTKLVCPEVYQQQSPNNKIPAPNTIPYWQFHHPKQIHWSSNNIRNSKSDKWNLSHSKAVLMIHQVSLWRGAGLTFPWRRAAAEAYRSLKIRPIVSLFTLDFRNLPYKTTLSGRKLVLFHYEDLRSKDVWKDFFFSFGAITGQEISNRKVVFIV